jgi:hypothetical protein
MEANKGTDVFQDMFRRLPEAELSASFRSDMMQKILQESAKMKKRSERVGLFATIATSIFIIAFGVLTIFYLRTPVEETEIPAVAIETPELTMFPFYTFIGVLTLLLLFADYKLRKNYSKKYQ